MKQQSDEYKRLENVKIFLNIQKDTEFSRFLGLKNSQIFSEIKRGKSKISSTLAKKICDKCPQISYEYLMEGNGDMLRPTIGDGAIVQQAIAGRDINGNVEQNTTSADISTLIAANAELTKQNSELIAIIKGQNQQLTQLINIQVKQQ